ncbi:MAG: LysR family transcriptional regulator [Gammaproteobacteria bacterium]
MAAPRITLDQWRALLAVVDEGSYSKAGTALNRSQSAVSYAVQQIETQLAVEAFRLEGRRAVLTSTGELLYRRARYLVDEAAGLEQAAQRASAGWEAEIRLSVDVIFPTWLLLDCLAALNMESPHTRIEVIESVLAWRTDTLTRGEADLAIFSSIPPGFLGDALMRVRFLPVASPDHPLHRLGKKLTLRELRAHRQLVVREANADRLTATTVDAPMRWTVSHLATSIEAVCGGYGFAFLPEHRIRNEMTAGTLKPLTLAAGGERFAELYLIFADRDQAGPATTRLAELLRATVARECRLEESRNASQSAEHKTNQRIDSS